MSNIFIIDDKRVNKFIKRVFSSFNFTVNASHEQKKRCLISKKTTLI